jgi:hypothetical protein
MFKSTVQETVIRPSRVAKLSWLAVTLVEPPFPLAVGFSRRLGWIPKSNLAASVSGICAFHENRQLLVPWIRTFGCLSSYGISNDLDGFLSWTLRARFQTPPLLTFQEPSQREGPRRPLESFGSVDRRLILRCLLPLWSFSPLVTFLFKEALALVPVPPPLAFLTKSPSGGYKRLDLSY